TMIIKLPMKPCEHKNGWGEGVITKEPTEAEEGVKTYTCEICKKTKTETIPKKAHTHIWNQGAVTKEPTETTPGEKTYTCTACSETRVETIPVTGKKPEEPALEVPGVIVTQGGTVEKGDVVKDQAAETTYRITNSNSSTKTVACIVAGSKEKEVTVPDKVLINNEEYKVTSVAKNAFKNKKTLEKVVLGKNVKNVDDNAFSGCKNLKKVSVNGKLTSIGDKAFYKCTSLTSVKIPSNVNKIGKQAFYGCKNLKNITIQTNKLTDKKVGSNAFKGISPKATIKVPKNKLSQYKKLLKKKGVSTKATIKK
ncbi:MAG: leucine-rich repeat domain-containing protein, partial [Clostridiales bacterium]|nr:leucine-rich repeat domain-containing protein [Clostridiales bacterium]